MMTSIALRRGVVAGMVAVAAAAGACGGTAAGSQPARTSESAAADDEAMGGLVEHHRYHHHGGVTLFIAMSLDTLGVSPEQAAAVKKIRAELDARMAPARAAEQRLEATLADGVAVGNIDSSKIDAAITQVSDAAASAHAASADALNQLHEVLTPGQRAALVDKVESHWKVWQRANEEQPSGTPRDESYFTMLAADLALSPDQVDKIRAGVGEGAKGMARLDPREFDTALQAFGSAFRDATFDAKSLAAASVTDAHVAGWGASHMTSFVEAAILVLTPEQRASFAQMLRQHATHDSVAQGAP
jgi:Spy/CpxP family protein refolding chaperone